jgi:hypothetical protein
MKISILKKLITLGSNPMGRNEKTPQNGRLGVSEARI